MNKKIIWSVIVIVIIGGLMWWNQSKEKAVVTGGSIKIGAAMGLSGYCAEFGEGELKAIRLVIDETNKNGGVNGQPLELVVEDTQCDGKGTANAVQKLISVNKVQAILGPTWGDSFQSGFPIAQNAGIVSISPSAAMEALDFTGAPIENVFSTWFPQRAEIQFLQKYALKIGLKEFVIIYDNDPFAEMMAELFKSEAKKNNITVMYSEKGTAGSDDFRTMITKAKSYPEAGVFVSFFSTDSKAKFIKQFKDLGLKNTVFSSADIENQTMLSAFPNTLEGIVFGSAIISGKNAEFIKKHNEKYGSNPMGPSAGQAYDAANILVAALKKGEVKDLSKNLLEVKVPGVTTDEVSFNDKHQITGGGYTLKTVKNNQFVELK